ncbi:MAG: RHS repeat-associated core domain-containing protein [Tabrizicola sp.]|jgi:RHS repeat-associated protein|nr:RHS repeat-associated core domain-containing protein [Tabrizicola sp.]
MASTSNEIVLDFTDGALTRRWLHGPEVDEPLAFLDVAGAGGTAYDLHADRQGSILRVVDPATGTVAAEYTYDSFGNRVATGTLDQRYAFTGREADGESGLLYFRARHYDPLTGMFLQRDPIGFASGDLNLYAYTWNNPTKWSDPSGLSVSLDYRNLIRNNALMAAGVAGVLCANNQPCQQTAGGLFGAIGNLASSIWAVLTRPTDNADSTPAPPPQCGPGGPGGPGGPEPEPPKNDWWKKVRNLVIPFLETLGLAEQIAEMRPKPPEEFFQAPTSREVAKEFEDLARKPEDDLEKMEDWNEDEENSGQNTTDDDNCRGG